jgi:hypothetical protein
MSYEGFDAVAPPRGTEEPSVAGNDRFQNGADRRRRRRGGDSPRRLKEYGVPGSATPPAVGPIEDRRERARQNIAYMLLGLLAILSVLAFATVWANGAAAAGQIVQTLFAPVAALTAGALGFFFASESRRSS